MTRPGEARRRTKRGAWAALCLAACALTADLPASSPAARAQWSAAHETARKMGRGVNILGYDGIWDGGVDAPFKEDYFRRIHATGFRHVRINLHAFKYMDVTNRIQPLVLDRLDWVIGQALRNDLIPVVDEHDFSDCQRLPEACGVKLIAFWKQLSARYAGKYPGLVFEILNEPGGRMTPAWWNFLAATILNDIRVRNPTRTVIVAAINSDDAGEVRTLELPANDPNVIVTVHYYKPMAFTHQGAEWSRKFAKTTGVDWGSAADKQQVTRDFDLIAAWAAGAGCPIYLGEFGVYDRADMDARSRYLSFVAREAERRGWAWAYWQFDHDFALFDSEREQWVRPVLDALIPPASAAPDGKASRF